MLRHDLMVSNRNNGQLVETVAKERKNNDRVTSRFQQSLQTTNHRLPLGHRTVLPTPPTTYQTCNLRTCSHKSPISLRNFPSYQSQHLPVGSRLLGNRGIGMVAMSFTSAECEVLGPNRLRNTSTGSATDTRNRNCDQNNNYLQSATIILKLPPHGASAAKVGTKT